MVGGAGAAAALPRHAGVVPTRPESARPLLVSYRPVADVLECAGLAGFSVAHVLAKAGHNVRVLEKLPALGAPAGGLRIPPDMSKLLAKWVGEEELRKTAVVNGATPWYDRACPCVIRV